MFTAGLLIAGLAGSMAGLVAGRIVQGLGGGMLSVALYVGMGQVVPPALHPRLFAMMAAAWVLPALLGPPIAAALVNHLGWRSVFLAVAAVVPLAAVLLLPAFARLPAPARTAAQPAAGARAHRMGRAGGAGARCCCTAPARQARAWAVALALGAGLVAAFAAARHLLPRGSLVAAPGMPAVIVLRGLLASAFGSAEVFVPLYLTREAGWSLAQAGLALSAAPCCGVAAVRCRRASPRHACAGAGCSWGCWQWRWASR